MDTTLLIWSIGAIVAGVLVVVGLRHLQKWQVIKDTPTSSVVDLFEGPGEIEGRVVELGDTLQSPLSQKPCVAYRFKVEEKRVRRNSEGKRRTTWRTLINDKQGVPFGVDDGTGIASINPDHAQMVLGLEDRTRSGYFDDAPPHLEATLSSQYGVSTKTWIFNKNLRYSEYVLEPGEPLYVLGEVIRESTEDPVSFCKGCVPYIVSDKNQDSLLTRFLWTAFGCWLGAIAVLAVCAYLVQRLEG